MLYKALKSITQIVLLLYALFLKKSKYLFLKYLSTAKPLFIQGSVKDFTKLIFGRKK